MAADGAPALGGRRTLYELLHVTPWTNKKSKNRLEETEAVGVVARLERLTTQKWGASEPKEKREVWIVDDSAPGGAPLAAKSFLWLEDATDTGDYIKKLLDAGEAPVLFIKRLEMSHIDRCQLGTGTAPSTQAHVRVFPAAPGTAQGSTAELDEQELALARRLQAWYMAPGVAEAATDMIAQHRRVKGDPLSSAIRVAAGLLEPDEEVYSDHFQDSEDSSEQEVVRPPAKRAAPRGGGAAAGAAAAAGKRAAR